MLKVLLLLSGEEYYTKNCVCVWGCNTNSELIWILQTCHYAVSSARVYDVICALLRILKAIKKIFFAAYFIVLNIVTMVHKFMRYKHKSRITNVVKLRYKLA